MQIIVSATSHECGFAILRNNRTANPDRRSTQLFSNRLFACSSWHWNRNSVDAEPVCVLSVLIEVLRIFKDC